MAAGTGTGAMTVPLTAGQLDAGLALLSTDLAYILDDLVVHPDVQAKIALSGFSELRLFAKVDGGDETKGVKTYLVDALSINAASSTIARSTAARVVLAWEAAQKRVSTRNTYEAEQQACDGPLTILKADFTNACRAFTDKHGEISDKVQSSQPYLELRLDQIKDNMFVAETWEEVTGATEDKSAGRGEVTVDRGGKLKMGRGISVGKVPTNSESLRQRFKVMDHHWELLRLKLPHKAFLKGYDYESTWARHADWILGEDVYGYTVEDTQSTASYSVPWKQLLEFEYQVRRRAMKTMNDGESLAVALRKARTHDQTLQKYLYIPLGIHAGQESARGQKRNSSGQERAPPPQKALALTNSAAASSAWETSEPKGHSKGKGKGGKDKSASWKAGSSPWTPDGRRKCNQYQRSACKNPKCALAHVCFVCNEKHPMKECGQRPKPEDGAKPR